MESDRGHAHRDGRHARRLDGAAERLERSGLVERGRGDRCFINQEGIVLQTENIAGAPNTVVFYEGPGGGPAHDAPLSDMLGDPSPNAFKGMGALLAAPQRNANDGNVWTVVGD